MRFAHIDVTSCDESTHVKQCLLPRVKRVEDLRTSRVADRHTGYIDKDHHHLIEPP